MADRDENRGALRARFWGVRGSHPAPGRGTLRVGGNSACVEVTAGSRTLIFDAGTGIIALGQRMVREEQTPVAHIFLSHFHHDHVEGLRYFAPAYRPNWHCHIYGPGTSARSVEQRLGHMMSTHLFPVALSELPARLDLHTLAKSQDVRFPGSPPVFVRARFSKAHPKVGVMLYRIDFDGRSIVYASDVEGPAGGRDDVLALAKGADVLILDSQYTDEEYLAPGAKKVGWGHTTITMAAEIARDAGVGQLVMFHHDPLHDDQEIRRLERLAKAIFRKSRAAREGMEVRVP